jgi:hypothetical protein
LLTNPISYWGSSSAHALTPNPYIEYDYDRCSNIERNVFWDTLLIIPKDLRYLGMGINEIDVSFENLAFADGQSVNGIGEYSDTSVSLYVRMGQTSNNSGSEWVSAQAINRTWQTTPWYGEYAARSETSIYTHESVMFKQTCPRSVFE